MAEFQELLRGRRSIRKFRSDSIPPEALDEILRVAAQPAHGRLMESYRVLAVSDRQTIDQMRAACVETIERRAAQWTPEDDASWAQMSIPFPKRDQIGSSLKDHYLYFSKRFDTFFGEAPVVLALATVPLRWKAAPHVWPTLQLVGAVMQTIQLAAWEKSIGSCCMTGPLHSRETHRRILHVEPPWEIVALLPLGYPQRLPPARPRKPLSAVLRWIPDSESRDPSETPKQDPAPVARFSALVERRRNVYEFGPSPVSRAEIEAIVDVVRLAPNSLNQQKWRFVGITDRDVLGKIRAAMVKRAEEIGAMGDEMAFLDAPDAGKPLGDPRAWRAFVSERADCLARAPAAIAVCNEAVPLGLTSDGWSDIESIGCAVETLMLAAAANRLNSCWMTSPLIAWQEVDGALGVEDPWRTVALVPVGAPRWS